MSVCLQDTHDQHEDEYQKELKALQAKYDALYGEHFPLIACMAHAVMSSFQVMTVGHSDSTCFSLAVIAEHRLMLSLYMPEIWAF